MSDKKDQKITIIGDINAGHINFGEQTFHGTVTFNMGALPSAEDSVRDELEALYTQLADALATEPAENGQDVEAVEQLAQAALDEANKEQPNKMLLKVTGDGLVQAAKNLAKVTPIAVEIAKKLLLIG